MNLPPVGEGERLLEVKMDPRRVREAAIKVMRSLADCDAFKDFTRHETVAIVGYVLGVYTAGSGAKLKPEVPVQAMLPAVCIGYREAKAMGLDNKLREGE